MSVWLVVGNIAFQQATLSSRVLIHMFIPRPIITTSLSHHHHHHHLSPSLYPLVTHVLVEVDGEYDAGAADEPRRALLVPLDWFWFAQRGVTHSQGGDTWS